MPRIYKPEEWAAEKIIELIKEGHLPPWAKSWSINGEASPRNLLNPKQFYRGLNYMLLTMVADMYGSPFFITPKQLFSMKGTKVKEGEAKKTWPVFFFSSGRKKDDDDDDKKKSHFFCKGYRVYNILQTEGIPAEKIPVLPEPETFAHTPIEACERIVEGYKACPEVVHQGQRACYSPSEDRIYMPNRERFVTPEEYYCTRFHEMAHSTGHKDRLNRAAIQHVSFASHAYSEEELVAEFTAAMLCGKAGIATKVIENSAAYIKSWSRKLKPEMLVLGSREARKAFEYLVGETAAEEVAA
jgi:antirestriction protein ArdC